MRRRDPIKDRAAEVLSAAGFTHTEIARAMGYKSPMMVYAMLGKPTLSIATRDPGRELKMVEAYTAGRTLDDIGLEYGITRERVRQLISKHGVNFRNSRKLVTDQIKARHDEIKEQARKTRWEPRAQQIYGCSYDEIARLNEGMNFSQGRAGLYMRQRQSAQMRNIEWGITFPEWCKVWDDSGKWDLRGRGKGHCCMSRKLDAGPYAKDNVQIITNERNASDSYITKPADIRFGCVRDELGFTPNQRRIYDLYALGLKPEAIAAQLRIKSNTVRCVLTQIRKITGAYDVKYGEALHV